MWVGGWNKARILLFPLLPQGRGGEGTGELAKDRGGLRSDLQGGGERTHAG